MIKEKWFWGETTNYDFHFLFLGECHIISTVARLMWVTRWSVAGHRANRMISWHRHANVRWWACWRTQCWQVDPAQAFQSTPWNHLDVGPAVIKKNRSIESCQPLTNEPSLLENAQYMRYNVELSEWMDAMDGTPIAENISEITFGNQPLPKCFWELSSGELPQTNDSQTMLGTFCKLKTIKQTSGNGTLTGMRQGTIEGTDNQR